MMRKAQISSQIFIYILAAVVIGMIVLVGYSAVNSVVQAGKDSVLQGFKSNFISAVSQTADNYDRQKKVILGLPDEFDTICFADSISEETKEFSQALKNNGGLDDYPLIENSIQSGSPENVFLLKGRVVADSFEVSNLDVEDNFICLDNKGQVSVWLKGTGKTALLYTE